MLTKFKLIGVASECLLLCRYQRLTISSWQLV